MQLKVVKLDLSSVSLQLERIADALEGILAASNPLPPDVVIEDDPAKTVSYGNENLDIIREHLSRLGKGYKE